MAIKSLIFPPIVHFGFNSLSKLSEISGSSVLIITGKNSMREGGFLSSAIDYLSNGFGKINIIDGIGPDPTTDQIIDLLPVINRHNPDWIVGLGGCSSIDAAKALWVFYEHPEETFENIFIPFQVPPLRKKARFISIPSTSGTGTEMAYAAVIKSVKEKTKYTIVSPEILPDIVILDPELTLTMPKHTTVITGLDAITHCIEPYVSTDHSLFTDAVAIHAFKTLIEYLPKVYQDSENRLAREQLHYASSLAGIAHGNAVLGVCHSIAHAIGGMYGIEHGLSNAIILPHVIEFNSVVAEERYNYLAELWGTKGYTGLIDKFVSFTKSFNLPISLKEAGVNYDILLNDIDKIAEFALKDDCTLTNPRKVEHKNIVDIIKSAY